MSLGQKETYTGTIVRRKINVGSKSEHDAIMIVLDGHQAPGFELRIGKNPFEYDKGLEAFIGKRVSVEGVKGSGVPALFVNSVSDISVINPPNNRPRSPRPPVL